MIFFASDSSSNDEPSDSQERRKEKLQSYLDNEFPAITSPIHTPIIEAYESTLIKIDSDIAQYQTDYPGLFRVISSMSRLFLNILVNNKRLVHREEAWKRIIIEILFPIRSKIDSSDKLRNRLFLTLIQLVLLSIRDDQKDINDLRKITDIVADAYLRKESSELASLSRKEAKQPLIPITSTKRISEDLREAEKALRLVLDEDELLNFREFVAIFEDRNREQQNEPSGSQ